MTPLLRIGEEPTTTMRSLLSLRCGGGHTRIGIWRTSDTGVRCVILPVSDVALNTRGNTAKVKPLAPPRSCHRQQHFVACLPQVLWGAVWGGEGRNHGVGSGGSDPAQRTRM